MMTIKEIARAALAEDVGHGDITTQSTVTGDARYAARIIAREPGVMSGETVARAVFECADALTGNWTAIADGVAFNDGDTVITFTGNAAILTGERVALNFLQRLCGVATMTRSFVQAIAGTNAKICDTRKTTPFLRALEKQAVIHGGGSNHRFGLYDAVLIKENHIAAAGGLREAIDRARAGVPHLTGIEVEVRDLDEFAIALECSPTAILLDNMDPDTIAKAVNARGDKPVLLEASGNMTADRAAACAKAGVDLVSVGALTHSAPSIDLSLLIETIDG